MAECDKVKMLNRYAKESEGITLAFLLLNSPSLPISSSYKILILFVRWWWHLWPSGEQFLRSHDALLSHRPPPFTEWWSVNRYCFHFTGNWDSVYPILFVTHSFTLFLIHSRKEAQKQNVSRICYVLYAMQKKAGT